MPRSVACEIATGSHAPRYRAVVGVSACGAVGPRGHTPAGLLTQRTQSTLLGVPLQARTRMLTTRNADIRYSLRVQKHAGRNVWPERSRLLSASRASDRRVGERFRSLPRFACQASRNTESCCVEEQLNHPVGVACDAPVDATLLLSLASARKRAVRIWWGRRCTGRKRQELHDISSASAPCRPVLW